MDLLDRLFTVIGAPSKNNLLIYCEIGFLLILFVAFTVYLRAKVNKLSKALKGEELAVYKPTRPLWNAYQKTLQQVGDDRLTVESAEEYLNDYSLLHASTQWNLIESIPSVLIGLGILGTFIGLTVGISGISFDNTDTIQTSIQGLLAGMSTAFVTSILGMSLSIIYSFILHYYHQRIIRRVQSLTLELDNKYKINQWNLAKIRSEEQRQALNSLFDAYFVDEIDGHRHLPKNVLRQLLQESTRQSSSLSNLADDIGRIMEDMLDSVLASNNEMIGRLIEDKLVPVLEDLKGIKEDSSANVIEQIVGELSRGMQAMLEEFKDSVAGETKKEMDTLAVRLTEVSQALLSIPDTMKTTTEDVYETLDVMRSLITESVEHAKEQQRSQEEQVEDAMKKISIGYEASLENLQIHIDRMLTTQKTNIEQTSEVVAEYERIVKENQKTQLQFRRIIDTSDTVVKEITQVAHQFTGHSTKLMEAATHLERGSDSITAGTKRFVNQNNELLTRQQSSINHIRETMREHTERFQVIESGLRSVFDQLQRGLGEYQETTAENLNKYLSQFSEAYTDAIGKTNSSIGQLNESIDELTEVFLKEAKKI